jgi:hypothetical protein
MFPGAFFRGLIFDGIGAAVKDGDGAHVREVSMIPVMGSGLGRFALAVTGRGGRMADTVANRPVLIRLLGQLLTRFIFGRAKELP